MLKPIFVLAFIFELALAWYSKPLPIFGHVYFVNKPINKRFQKANFKHQFLINSSKGVENSASPEFLEDELSSAKITSTKKKLEELRTQLAAVTAEIEGDKKLLAQLDLEYGSEIARVKKEFSRIKERSYEEAAEISNNAKLAAIKEVLPITDNYYRAKGIFGTAQTEHEKNVLEAYDSIFKAFTKVLEDFGVSRVVSLGEPFDFNFMEAIMTAPSNEYPKDIVCTEYQVGYKMGEKCVRPAMVVVSLGPGPN